MKRLYMAILGALLFCSCGKKVLVDDERHFANDTWNRFTPEKFDVEVGDPEGYYNINVEAVVDSARMRNDRLPLVVNFYSPNGERRMFYTDIALVENGRWKGKPLPGRERDGWRVVSQCIRPFFIFNVKGTHNIEISQGTSQFDLDGVRSFRLQIEEAEMDFKGLND